MSADARTLAHRSDPDTSHKAASGRERKQILFSAILQLLELHPRTAEACELAYFAFQPQMSNWPKVAPYSVKRRLSELHKQGRVVDTGRREYTSSGRPAVVWAVAGKDTK